jgi:hypothetical protein
MVGLLVAVAGAWIALAFGWQVTAPPLAPGATFRSADRNLTLNYVVPATNTLEALLTASLQEIDIALSPLEAARHPLGQATLQARPAFPGVWIATSDGSAQLSLPGEGKLRSYIGLVFPNPGSEESLLLPDYGVGLRVVQRTGSPGFVLELYRSDAIRPIYRAELTQGGQLTIPVEPDEAELLVTLLPGLQVDVRRLPGLWLVPLGIVLAIVGATAYLRPSAFVVAQVSAWGPAQSLIILQTDTPTYLDTLRAALIVAPVEIETSAQTTPQTTSQNTSQTKVENG